MEVVVDFFPCFLGVSYLDLDQFLAGYTDIACLVSTMSPAQFHFDHQVAEDVHSVG